MASSESRWTSEPTSAAKTGRTEERPGRLAGPALTGGHCGRVGSSSPVDSVSRLQRRKAAPVKVPSRSCAVTASGHHFNSVASELDWSSGAARGPARVTRLRARVSAPVEFGGHCGVDRNLSSVPSTAHARACEVKGQPREMRHCGASGHHSFFGCRSRAASRGALCCLSTAMAANLSTELSTELSANLSLVDRADSAPPIRQAAGGDRRPLWSPVPFISEEEHDGQRPQFDS